MSQNLSYRASYAQGFTLIESIIVLVLLGIAAVGIKSMQSKIFNGQSDGRTMEIGAQLMQECAEQVLAVRRNVGFTSVTTSTCNIPTITSSIPGSFSAPTLTMKDDGNNTITTCSSTTCTVTVSISTGSTTLTPVVLQLVSY